MAKRFKMGRGASALLLVVILIAYLGIRFTMEQPREQSAALTIAPGTGSFSAMEPEDGPAMVQTASTSLRLNARDQSKLAILDQVLASRNDNDPRLDEELKGLSAELKSALIEKYHSLRPEDRNAKGTVVFLLGRELQTPADVAFMEEVLGEPPCQSLGDCSRPPSNPSSEEAHMESATGVTLAYPQLVALYALNKITNPSERSAETLGAAARKALEAAQQSTDAVVSRKARAIASQLSQTGSR